METGKDVGGLKAKSEVAAALAPPDHITPNTPGDSQVESRINNPRFYSAEEILHDGASIHIRHSPR